MYEFADALCLAKFPSKPANQGQRTAEMTGYSHTALAEAFSGADWSRLATLTLLYQAQGRHAEGCCGLDHTSMGR